MHADWLLMSKQVIIVKLQPVNGHPEGLLPFWDLFSSDFAATKLMKHFYVQCVAMDHQQS